MKRIKGKGLPDSLVIPLADSKTYRVELIKNGEVDTENLSYLLKKSMRNSEIFGARVLDSDGKKVGLVVDLKRVSQNSKRLVVLVAETDDYVALLKMQCRILQEESTEAVHSLRLEQ